MFCLVIRSLIFTFLYLCAKSADALCSTWYHNFPNLILFVLLEYSGWRGESEYLPAHHRGDRGRDGWRCLAP